MYPLSGVRANVGRLCEKLKIVMKNGLRWNLRRQLLGDICGNGFERKTELFKPDFWTVKAVRF